MTTMTREQRIARANEIFDRVWGQERTTADELDDMECELRMTAEDLDDNAAKIKALIERLDLARDDEDNATAETLAGVWEYVEYLEQNSKALWELAKRLDSLDLDERAA